MTPDFIRRARARHNRAIWTLAAFWLGVIFASAIIGVL